MPVYNGAKYIRESIESVLMQTFKDFEFIIVDDGSTDNTESIIKSYIDNRIVYIKKNHSGIADALNMGIKKSSGKYIVRMDSDDRMYFDRLEYQYNWMENHADVDIMGAGFEWGNGKEETEYFNPGNYCVTKQILMNGNKIGHPTVIMRSSSIMKLPFLYEGIYNGAEDYKLWLTASSHGLVIYNNSHIVNYYRQHKEQETIKNYNKSATLAKRIQRAYTNKNENSKSKLTVIIPFQNEIYEVEKTVMSVRATANDVKIILINDNSTQDYNYKRIAEIFGCDYYENKTNLGVAGSRDFGVAHCTTPYFTLLDAHMRLYDDNWDLQLIKLLDNNKDRILCSNTVIISKDDNGVYDNEDGHNRLTNVYGAFINMSESGHEYTAKWSYKNIDNNDNNIIRTPCVLGAAYTSSVEWWNKIGGLHGLIKYGLDEPLMSIKTWLAGGEVLLLKDWGVGHLYRSKFTYPVTCTQVDCNQLFLINMFSPEDKKSIYIENLKKRIGDNAFNMTQKLYNSHIDEFNRYIEEFNKVKKYDIDYFLKEINDKAI